MGTRAHWTRSPLRWARGQLFAAYYVLNRRGQLWRRAGELDDIFFQNRNAIDTMVREKLAILLQHAAQTVPFYRECLGDKKITLDNAREVLDSLPIVTKPMIRTLGDRLLSDKVSRKPYWNTSGGSTGEPIRIRQDRRYGNENRISELLFMRWAGFRPGERHAVVWARPKETFGAKISPHEKAFRFAHNQHSYNCYTLTNEVLDDWLVQLSDLKPLLIEAYVDAAYELALRARLLGIAPTRPRAVITSAGVLTSEKRSLIEEQFRCRVLDRYGSREVGDIACSCLDNTGLHVNESQAFIEVVDEQGQACRSEKEGEVLVTVLSNFSMPLIRYQIQDRASWASGPCDCGRKTLRLERIAGRSNDCLRGKNGVRLSGNAIPTLLYSVSGIRRYQFRQSSGEEIILLIQALENASEDALAKEVEAPLNALRNLLKVPVRLKFTTEIPLSGSGKMRYVTSEGE